jgi:hypothetical protein
MKLSQLKGRLECTALALLNTCKEIEEALNTRAAKWGICSVDTSRQEGEII